MSESVLKFQNMAFTSCEIGGLHLFLGSVSSILKSQNENVFDDTTGPVTPLRLGSECTTFFLLFSLSRCATPMNNEYISCEMEEG